MMILGQPGSGRSSLARSMGVLTGLPVPHIDRIHRQSGWIERNPEEKTRLCRDLLAREAWVLEGDRSPTRVSRVVLPVWPDRPMGLRAWGAMARCLSHLGRTRPGLPEGRPGRLRNLAAFLASIWRRRRTARDGLARLASDAACPVARLRSDEEVAPSPGELEAVAGGTPSPGKAQSC